MTDRYEPPQEAPGAARSAALRRLSRLTWRATQLSAVTAVGFATVFARTAPVRTADQVAATPSTGPSAASPAGTTAPPASPRHDKPGPRTSPGVRPTAQAGQAATPSGSSASTPGSAGSPSASGAGGGSGAHSSSPAPTLAPPSSAPAVSSAPAPQPTVSSGSHAGG